jgi:hypothetical protein
MREFFKILGIVTLLCGSFIYTEKATTVVKDMDDIMIKIKQNKDVYYVPPVEAVIENNTIIPGINGSEIDVNRSYQNMRSVGLYSDKYFRYKVLKVTNSLDNNKDKYIISGNRNKGIVSLVFIVEKDTDIENVIKILKKNKTKATFFIDGTWLENNNDEVYNIINNGHDLGSIGYNYNYSNSSYPWLDNIIKRVAKQKNSYCIKTNHEALQKCIKNNNYTISSDIIDRNPLISTKDKLTSGAIIVYKINMSLEEELPLIIDYIHSKGLTIDVLKNLLIE